MKSRTKTTKAIPKTKFTPEEKIRVLQFVKENLEWLLRTLEEIQ